MKIRKAVVLAAGRGQRLHPYTLHTPKPMLRLVGMPLLERLLGNLRALGVSQVLIITGHLEEEIRAYFGRGSTLGLELSYRVQQGSPGTGAALLLAQDFVRRQPFLSSWGDALAHLADTQALVQRFERQPGVAWLLLEKVDDPHRGAAVYLEGGQVRSLVEKPAPGTSSTCWNPSGVAIYSSAIFSALESLPPSPRGEIELTAGVQALVDTGRPVRGLPMQHPRLHLTSPADIPQAEALLRADSTL